MKSSCEWGSRSATGIIWVGFFQEDLHSIACTENCKLVVTCKMQNRNATDKLNQQCSKLAEICGRITMLIYYIADLAYQLHFYFAFASDNQLAILCNICLQHVRIVNG